MPDEYIKIGKDNYRYFYSYSNKSKADDSAERLREKGYLVRVIKKVHKMSIGPKESVYRVYFCSSRKRQGLSPDEEAKKALKKLRKDYPDRNSSLYWDKFNEIMDKRDRAKKE